MARKRKTRDFVKALKAAGGSVKKLRPVPKTLGQIACEAAGYTWSINTECHQMWERAAAAVEKEVLRRLAEARTDMEAPIKVCYQPRKKAKGKP